MSAAVVHACDLLHAWLRHAEGDWYDAGDGGGVYGTGYGHWGVHTGYKHCAAAAACAELHPGLDASERERWRGRAVAEFRFLLRAHRSAGGACLDGEPWGCTWISALGIERMAFALPWILPRLDAAERDGWARLVATEADWLTDHHERGGRHGIHGTPWEHQGGNHGESNLWNGAFLWRAACTHPDHAHAARWREQALRFLVNAVSLAADAQDATPVDGRPVRERHVGANFHPRFAFDHHGYLNVGYMAICVSNAAILHFDAATQGWPLPQSLDWHQDGLWAALKRMCFADGRLARIGGDGRVRYAYCQEFALPAYLYAAARWRDPHAAQLADGLVALMAREAADNGDGSFYGRRLAELRAESPYYVVRLESDRACALAMYALWRPRVPSPPSAPAFEAAVAGGWCDPDHGAALVRSPRRFASLAWRAKGLAQVLCLPPEASDLADWRENGTGAVRFAGEDESLSLVPGAPPAIDTVKRTLLAQTVEPFAGGFVGCARIAEGEGAQMSEWWRGAAGAVSAIAVAALPDDATVCVLRLTRAHPQRRAWLRHASGLRLLVPNDVYNSRRRRLVAERGAHDLRAPVAEDAIVPLGRWACVDDRLGAVGLYGADGLVLHRSRVPRGGSYRSLRTEELDWGRSDGLRPVAPGATILDGGWLLLCADAAATERCAGEHAADRLAVPDPVRAVRLRGRDGRDYVFAAHLGAEGAVTCDLPAGRDCATGSVRSGTLELAPGQAVLLALG